MGKSTYRWAALNCGIWKIPMAEFVDSYSGLVKNLAAAEFASDFVQAAFPMPESKVDIQDFMNHESFKIELTSEILKLEKRFEAIQLRQQSMVPFWLTRPPIIY